ncbi:MAG: hypothetical protein C0490_28580, partial [Marivirga sp.]|nr:hypothetical protein [Marivirga sp.]
MITTRGRASLKETFSNIRKSTDKISCVLVCPPFAPTYTPSLGLSILKKLANDLNVKCVIKYSNIDFSELIGSEIYDLIADGFPSTTDM